MASPHPTSAARRVFGVVELTEKIILDLPSLQDIIRFQRVATLANQVIQDSTAIRQRLHLAPEPESDSQANDLRRIVPVLPKHMRLNIMDDYVLPNVTLPFNSSQIYATKSWQQMLLTQPPLQRLTLTFNISGVCNGRCPWGHGARFEREVGNPNGVELGDVEMAVQEELRT